MSRSVYRVVPCLLLLAIMLTGQAVLSQDSILSEFAPDRNDLRSAFGPTVPSADDQESLLDLGRDPFEFATSFTAALDIIYDDGVVGSGNILRPATLALDGTPAARGSGRYNMFATGSAFQFVFGETSTALRARALTEADFSGALLDVQGVGMAADGFLGVSGSSIRLTRAFGVIDVFDSSRISAGQDFTTFQDNDALPVSVSTDGTPAGSVFKRVPQLRYTRDFYNGITWSFAIENPVDSDFVLPDPAESAPMAGDQDVRLRQAPDLITNVRFVDPCCDINRIQLAAMVRWLAYEDGMRDEHTVTGWGVMASARYGVFGTGNFHLGGVVGEGIGDYLFGFAGSTTRSMNAAGPIGPAGPGREITPWTTVGCHIGYQQLLTARLQANIAYGYAFADTEINGAMDEVVRKTQNGWVNVVYKVSDSMVIGLEYHHALLDVADGRQGDNSRLQLAFRVSK